MAERDGREIDGESNSNLVARRISNSVALAA